MVKKAEFIITAKDKAKAVFDSTEKRLNDIARSAVKLGGVLSGISFAGIAVGIFKTTAEMEKLKASLKTVTGSAENANLAFEGILDFSKNTPFQIEETTSAFIKLKALGLEPSERALLSYGNTASAMGKSLNQMIEAVADAATGEFERLKEFGIKARSEGDNVSFTFQGVTTTVRKNAEEIEGYLMGIGETQFAGAMEEQMNTLNGVMSNLQDTVSQLLTAEGAGLDSLKGSMKDLTDNLSDPKVKEGIQNLVAGFVAFAGTMAKITAEIPAFTQFLGETLAKAMHGAADPIERVDDRIEEITDRLRIVRGIMQSSGAGIVPPQVEEEFDRLANELVEMRALRQQLSDDINNKPIKSIVGDGEGKSKLDQLAEESGQGTKSPGVSGGLTDDKIEGQLTKLETFLMSEQQIEQDAYMRRQQILFDAQEQDLINEQAYNELFQGLKTKHEEKLTEIAKKGAKERNKFTDMALGDQLGVIAGGMSQITSLMDDNNRKDFENKKKASLATAVVSTASAVIQSWDKAGGYPWGIIPAGIMALTGLKTIQNIKQSSFGGGSAPAIASGGGGGSSLQQTPSLPDLSRQQPQQMQRAVNITISGPVDRQFLKDALIPALQEEIDENDVTFIGANSAQARELKRAS